VFKGFELVEAKALEDKGDRKIGGENAGGRVDETVWA
jgi:hypothetical protein